MEPLRSTSDRSLLEPCTDFDPAAVAGLSAAVPLTIRSLSVFKPSLDDYPQTLIFVGTGGGKILLFSLNPSDSTAEFLKSAPVSNRLIESILVLDEIGRILVLSDGFLFLIDLFLLQPARKVAFLKGVTAFSKRVFCSDDAARNSSDLFGRDAVKSPRSKFLQKLANGSGTRVSEAKREEGASCFVAAAAGKGLVLMKLISPIEEVQSDSEHGGISISWKEIQGIEAVKTMAWLGDSVIFGTSEGYTLYSVTSGKATLIFLLPEASGPPRLRCLWRTKEVMLLVDNVGVVANEAGQPVGGSLIFQYAPESVVEMGCYVIVARDERLDLYSRKSGVCMQSLSVAKGSAGPCIMVSNDRGNGEVVVIATTYKIICYRKVSAEEQIKDLLRKKNFKEAICLVEEFESEGEISREMLSFVHAQVGFLLLFDLHFEEAVNHFLLSEAMQPSEIFPLIMRDPNRWSHLVPRNRYWGLHPPPVPLEQLVDDGLMAIQRAIFLRKAGVETAADEDFLLNPPSRANLLQSAIENIIRYLCVSREKDLIPSVKEGVDTLLMYLYRALNREKDMEHLASSQNSCVVEELETLLDDSGHLRTLAFLYASKGMCSKALAIWRILARNYSTGLWKDPAPSLEHDSSDISTDLISGEKAAAMEASKLLPESSDQDLVLEHLGWIADIDEELAVMVLTSEKRVNQLSPDEVLAAVNPKKVEIQQRIAKFEELVDIARQFLICFCQELETFRRPQLYKTSKVVDHIIESNQTDRMKAYVEGGSRHRHHDIQNISKLHSCIQGLQDHLTKVKVLLDELECLKEDAIGIARKVNHSATQFLDTCISNEGLSLEEENIAESMHLQDKSISHATLMTVLYNMLRLDYTMQENIINSINISTATKSEQLESYCVMWNLRPYINDNVMRQCWKLFS